MSKTVADIINGMNGGRGLHILTEEGLRERDRRERAEKKARGIHWNTDVSIDEPWVRAIQAELFAPENEGRYWEWTKEMVG